MPYRPLPISLALTLLLALSSPGCNRHGKDPKDKVDDIPRGTGGTPATQITRPAQ